MATAKKVLCEPCEHKNITKYADICCNECGEGYCNECVKSHSLIKALRNHNLISTENYLKISNYSSEEFCADHNTICAFFCSQHDSILCLSCLQTIHSKCKLLDLDEASKDSKTSTATTMFEADVEDYLLQIKEKIEKKDDNLSSLKDQEQKIPTKINEIRSTINAHLDTLQGKILSQLQESVQKKTGEIELDKKALQQTEREWKQTSEGLAAIKAFGSDKQLFIAVRKNIESLQRKKESASSDLSNDASIQLSFKVDDSALSILHDMKSLGTILIDKISKPTARSGSNRSQVQFNVQPSSDIGNIQLNLKQKIEIIKGSKQMSHTGCVLMPDKTMVFVDNSNNRLTVVYNADRNYKFDIFLKNRPFDATAINNHCVAVTVPYEMIIEIVDVHKRQVDRTILCTFSGWGISYYDDRIYVSCSDSNEIIMLSISGNVLKQIPTDTGGVFNIAMHKQTLYFISSTSNTLYAFGETGKQIWAFKDSRLTSLTCFAKDYSTSLCTDSNGNVFVAPPGHNLLTIIANDGTASRDILNFCCPCGVSFLRDTNELLVCGARERYAAVYSVCISSGRKF